MSSNSKNILLGFVLGIGALLVMGQSKAPSSPPMRFMIAQTGYGLVVQDTTTGAVKLVTGDPRSSQVPGVKIEYGQPFYP